MNEVLWRCCNTPQEIEEMQGIINRWSKYKYPRYKPIYKLRKSQIKRKFFLYKELVFETIRDKGFFKGNIIIPDIYIEPIINIFQKWKKYKNKCIMQIYETQDFQFVIELIFINMPPMQYFFNKVEGM